MGAYWQTAMENAKRTLWGYAILSVVFTGSTLAQTSIEIPETQNPNSLTNEIDREEMISADDV